VDAITTSLRLRDQVSKSVTAEEREAHDSVRQWGNVSSMLRFSHSVVTLENRSRCTRAWNTQHTHETRDTKRSQSLPSFPLAKVEQTFLQCLAFRMPCNTGKSFIMQQRVAHIHSTQQ
jgi:hypothetical protein